MLTATRIYVTPIDSTGAVQVSDSEPTWDTARGVFTLAVGTYYFVLPVKTSSLFDLHLTHDATLAAVATIQTCSHAETDVSDHSTIAGEWLDSLPPGAYVQTAGAGTSAGGTGIVTIAGTNAGGAVWPAADVTAHRVRLQVVVTVPGEVRVSFTGKE